MSCASAKFIAATRRESRGRRREPGRLPQRRRDASRNRQRVRQRSGVDLHSFGEDRDFLEVPHACWASFLIANPAEGHVKNPDVESQRLPETPRWRYNPPPMTTALQKAFEVASKLPAQEQDELAAAIFEELRAEQAWGATLAASLPTLERLAEEALREHRAGRTKPLDPDRL